MLKQYAVCMDDVRLKAWTSGYYSRCLHWEALTKAKSTVSPCAFHWPRPKAPAPTAPDGVGGLHEATALRIEQIDLGVSVCVAASNQVGFGSEYDFCARSVNGGL